MDITVLEAVRADLAEIAKVDLALSRSGLAATALVLAAELDARTSATSKSMCANALRDILAELREMVPPQQVSDTVSSLADRAKLKLAGRAGA